MNAQSQLNALGNAVQALVGGATTTVAQFTISVGDLGAPTFTVLSLQGTEAMSQLFSFSVDFVCTLEPAEVEAQLLGQPATLTMMTLGGGTRAVQGIVAAFETRGLRTLTGSQDPMREYTVRIRPRMWLLKRRKRSRVFQNMTLSEIVDLVLGSQIPHRWQLTIAQAQRTYCVQYRETDHAFVTRLLAEAGIFFYFEPSPVESAPVSVAAPSAAATGGAAYTGETVVFCDQVAAYPAIATDGGSAVASVIAAIGSAVGAAAPSLPYRHEHQRHDSESVSALTLERAIKPKSVMLRDYDFLRPALPIVAKARVTPPPPQPQPRLGQPAPTLDTATYEIYDHHGEYEETDAYDVHAQVHLDQHRAKLVVGKGASDCRRFSAGYRFTLTDHAQAELDQEYVVTQVSHTGKVPERTAQGVSTTYSNTFECVASSVPFRPKRPRRRVQQAVETGRVVGAGEDTFTDEYGRIKVQLHWDREGQFNEFSSCWMRVIQPWAGAGWGAQFIPRIGMEVLVGFAGGDVDRPVVLGCLYNGTHPLPFNLPEAAARSGIRTQSMPGGDGYNELSFADDAGAEQVFLHAQRDFVAQIRNAHALSVGENHTIQVLGDQNHQVEQGRTDIVGQNQIRTVGGNDSFTVKGEECHRTVGSRLDIVDGAWTQHVSDGQVTCTSNLRLAACSGMTVAVGTSDDAQASYSTKVFGNLRTYTTNLTEVNAEKKLVLECGTTKLTLEPKKLTIEADDIVINAAKSITATSKGPSLKLTDQAELSSEKIQLLSKGGYVKLDEDKAKVFGPSVEMASGTDPPETSDSSSSAPTQHFKYKMLDGDMQPYASKTYTLITQGFSVKATTDANGFVEQDIPKDAITVEVTLWTEDYPTGPRLLCSVQIEDLPPSNQPRGAAMRLRHLGYYRGPDTDDVDPVLADALTWFQADNQLPLTGELDAATIAKLGDQHVGA